MARTIYKAKPKGWQVRYAARLAKVTKERAADKCGTRQCQPDQSCSCRRWAEERA